MSKINIYKKQISATNGVVIQLAYDEQADILEVVFGQNEPATGIELTDHILLRLNQTTKRALSLTLLHFSILAERTEYGPRSYPLDRLDELPEELRQTVLHILTTPPVNQLLKVSHFQVSSTQSLPLTFVDSSRFASVA